MRDPAPRIDGAEEIAADARWLDRRPLFDRLYAASRSVPYLHVGCRRPTGRAQYLRRAGGGVVCPACGRALGAGLVRSLGLSEPDGR